MLPISDHTARGDRGEPAEKRYAAGRRELQHSIRRLEYGARLIARALAAGPVALLFGSEKYGLSNDDMSHCHWLMRIPTTSQE